jgi:hypothetical protein
MTDDKGLRLHDPILHRDIEYYYYCSSCIPLPVVHVINKLCKR